MDTGCVKWNLAPSLVYTLRPKVDRLSNEGYSKTWVQPHTQRDRMRKPVGKEMPLGSTRPGNDQCGAPGESV